MATSKTRIKLKLSNFRKDLLDKLTKDQTERLLAYAREELYEMILTKEFHSRTFNLVDSYVWAVFYNKKKKGHGVVGAKLASKKSFLHEWSKTPIPVDGRRAAMDFLKRFQANEAIENGWTIVWAACAPYAKYLDPAVGSTKTNRFFVISQRYDHIKHTLEPKCKVRLEVNPPKY